MKQQRQDVDLYGELTYIFASEGKIKMITPNSTSKSARLETRVSPEQKELIERAAAYTGSSVSDFVVANVEIAAKRIVEEYERLHLNQTQSRTLVDALLSPKRPNKKLRTAAANHRGRVESR